MGTPLLTPPPDDRACYHCVAWSNWDTQTIGRENPNGSFVVLGKQPLGQCRAAPPTIDPQAYDAATAAWPIVRANDWCRSFERRPADGHPHDEGGAR